jgi:PAS domain S-box-containing protein
MMNHLLDRETLVYLSPYLISFGVLVILGLYAWHRRQVAGAREFALYTWATSLFTLFFMLELITNEIGEKILWDNFQYVVMLIAPILFIIFVLSYSGWRPVIPRFAGLLIVFAPILLAALLFTDSLHGFFRPDSTLIPGEPFSALRYSFTLLFWLIIFYVYALMFLGIFYLIRLLTRSDQLYRRQVAIILVGILILLITAILPVFDVVLVFQRDITPFGFLVCNLVIAWGLFRYHFLDVVPVAYHTVVYSNPDAVIILDARERIVDMNPAAVHMAGKKLEEVLGCHVKEVFDLIPGMIAGLENLPETHKEFSHSVNGEARLFDLRVSTLIDNSGQKRGWAIVARDITVSKQSEIELKKRTEQLERANRKLEATNTRLHVLGKAKDEFVSNVSHELRTPISNLKLYIDLLRMRPENQARYLDTLERETNRLENMIEGLLMLSRLDQERVAFHFHPVDLNELVEEYVLDRGQLAESKGLHLQRKLTPGLPLVKADRNLIGQVLSILLTNALNYTPEGGMVSVSTQSCQRDGQEWVGMLVMDNGRGIPEDEQRQLFTRFFRGSAAQEAEVAGTGLGLAICKEIVTRHKGTIEVASSGLPGEGSLFSVWLPAQFSMEEPDEE